MTHIRGIAEIVLHVRDKQAAVAFYRDLLGLEMISPPELPNVFLKAGPGQAGIPQMIVLVPLPADAGPFVLPRTLHHLALEVAPEDFDALGEHLRANGFAPRDGRHPVIASRTLYVDDPDGNEVEIICAEQ
jgi:catechol 2,3-dioxygenase-like lactoylglutathione lyase family enzyme